MIGNILDNTTELYMIKYTFGEIFSSDGATLYKNPSDQTVNWFSHIILGLKKEIETLKIYKSKFRHILAKLKKCEQQAGSNPPRKKYGFIKGKYGKGECAPFDFFGCGGNQNRFSSKRKCQYICKVGPYKYRQKKYR